MDIGMVLLLIVFMGLIPIVWNSEYNQHISKVKSKKNKLQASILFFSAAGISFFMGTESAILSTVALLGLGMISLYNYLTEEG